MFGLFIVLLILLIFYTTKKKNNIPPLAIGHLPIVGHTFKLLCNPEGLFKFLVDLSMDAIKKGGVVTLQIAGENIYGIVDPEDANTVLNSCLQKDVIYDYFKPWLGDGLIAAAETTWKRHRKLLNPTFNQVVLHGYLPELNKLARALLHILESKVGSHFDHAPALEYVTLQAICSTAMGVVIDEDDKRIRKQYTVAKSSFENGLVERAQKFWLHSEFIYNNFSSLSKRQIEHVETLSKLTNAVIKKRRIEMQDDVTKQHFKPFLDHLLTMESDGIFTDTEVKEQTDTFTFAGSDTLSVTLTITLLAIASYPNVQLKIYEELTEVFHGSDRNVEKQDLMQLKYLEAVIKESLRLHSIIPVVGRRLDKDLKIKNYTLRSGSRCYVSLYGVNRHTAWGPDAEQFLPERWLDPASLPDHNTFAAFGMGKRRCIGSVFAIMSVKTTLSHILRQYQVFGDITQLEQSMEIIARPVPKNYIRIEKRSPINNIE